MYHFDKDGLLHNENGPAVDLGNVKRWYIRGKLHNDNGPAVIETFDCGATKQWWINGIPTKFIHCEGTVIEFQEGIPNKITWKYRKTDPDILKWKENCVELF
jgi:hypothetical protein